jgi:hypothetical protein
MIAFYYSASIWCTERNLLLNLSKDFRIFEEVVFLHENDTNEQVIDPLVSNEHTSSPTLIELPPHPGNRTRSPAFT